MTLNLYSMIQSLILHMFTKVEYSSLIVHPIIQSIILHMFTKVEYSSLIVPEKTVTQN